jgi:hypothetical protein
MTRTWWQKLVPPSCRARRAGRRANRAAQRVSHGAANVRRLALLRLEDRMVPAVVSYTTASGALTFTGDAGEADIVSVSAPAANQVQIRVGNGDAITLAADAAANANFVLSSSVTPNDTLTIATGPGQAPATTFAISLGDLVDRLDFSLATTPNGVGSVAIDLSAQGPSYNDAVTFNVATSVGANLSVMAGAINTNASITAAGGVALTSFNTLNVTSAIAAGGDVTLTSNFDGVNLSANIATPGNVALTPD